MIAGLGPPPATGDVLVSGRSRSRIHKGSPTAGRATPPGPSLRAVLIDAEGGSIKPRGVAPQAVEAIEAATFFGEDVNHEVAIVE